jgi:hypothetical protein
LARQVSRFARENEALHVAAGAIGFAATEKSPAAPRLARAAGQASGAPIVPSAAPFARDPLFGPFAGFRTIDGPKGRR